MRHIYTNEEIEIILNRFKNNKVFICAFLTACYTGMRTGEVFALTWNDIDLKNRTIKTIKLYMQKIKKIKEDGIWGQQKQQAVAEKFIFVIPCIQCYTIIKKYRINIKKNMEKSINDILLKKCEISMVSQQNIR